MSTPQPDNKEEEGGEKEEDVVGWLLMERCWSECGEQLQGCAVRFIQDPYSSLLVFQSSSSYITINGNEESCGSSFADSGTSFMATLHSTTTTTTPTIIMHHASPSLSTNFNAPAAADDDDGLLSTFLGLPDHHHHDDEEDLLPPNSQL